MYRIKKNHNTNMEKKNCNQEQIVQLNSWSIKYKWMELCKKTKKKREARVNLNQHDKPVTREIKREPTLIDMEEEDTATLPMI